MSDKKGLSPLALLVGLVAGAAGALVLSDKKPNMTKKVIKRVKETLNDWQVLGQQEQLDKPKGRKIKSKK